MTNITLAGVQMNRIGQLLFFRDQNPKEIPSPKMFPLACVVELDAYDVDELNG